MGILVCRRYPRWEQTWQCLFWRVSSSSHAKYGLYVLKLSYIEILVIAQCLLVLETKGMTKIILILYHIVQLLKVRSVFVWYEYTWLTTFGGVYVEIGEKQGPFDLALIPIGAYSPRWFMSTIHCSPEDAVRVHEDVKSKRSVSCIWLLLSTMSKWFVNRSVFIGVHLCWLTRMYLNHHDDYEMQWKTVAMMNMTSQFFSLEKHLLSHQLYLPTSLPCTNFIITYLTLYNTYSMVWWKGGCCIMGSE